MNIIYMINDDNVTEIDLGKFKNIKKRVDFKIDKQIPPKISSRNIQINLNTKKVYIVIEGEEIYIKCFKFPKVSEDKLYDLINNELNYLYRNEKFVFSYKKIRQSNKGIEVIVFYLRAENLSSINKFVGNKNLKAVRLIQMCFLNYYKKIIKEKDYYIFFRHGFNNYMILIKNDDIYANEVCSIQEDDEYNKIKKFIMINYEKNNKINKIYVVGQCIKNESSIDFLKKYGEVNFLKDIDVNKIVKLII